jgi:hypothetical protein
MEKESISIRMIAEPFIKIRALDAADRYGDYTVKNGKSEGKSEKYCTGLLQDDREVEEGPPIIIGPA